MIKRYVAILFLMLFLADNTVHAKGNCSHDPRRAGLKKACAIVFSSLVAVIKKHPFKGGFLGCLGVGMAISAKHVGAQAKHNKEMVLEGSAEKNKHKKLLISLITKFLRNRSTSYP
jgi:hypothetical protein